MTTAPANRAAMGFYGLLKTVHVFCVALSATLFVGRGVAGLLGVDWRRWRFLRVAPHLVDTALLASAVAMTWILGLSPLANPWLGAKLTGLAAYIVLGVIALKPGRSRRVRRAAFAAALVALAYIVSVALSKDPRGFLAGW